MAFYTPPSLPRTPSNYTMNATLPSLPSELSWPLCRHPAPKEQTPLTPPMTSTFEQRRMLPQVRVTTTLPPIAHLDRHISTMPPLTPPDEDMSSSSSDSSSRLPPINDYPSEFLGTDDQYQQAKPYIPSDAPYLVDWLDVTRTRSAHFVAEKTCEMICYLWFSSQSPSPARSYPSPNPNDSPQFLPRPTPATTTLQLVATPTFVQFMQKLLETTQVSQSVIVLSLHYIYRLKERNRFTAGQPGSEFRIAVAALMMANKFLDDNTYTNKTWSEVSGIDLTEINKMEREFLLGVNFNLYVDKSTYESWLNLLKGLVMAKERDSRQWRKSRGLVRLPRLPQHTPSQVPPSRSYSSRYRSIIHRARSTSPGQTTRSLALAYTSSNVQPSPASSSRSCSHTFPAVPGPALQTGLKRSAEAAFSPTSASFSHLPTKRPVSISLHIPEYAPATAPSSHSPLEGLQSFAKLCIGSSPHAKPPPSRSTGTGCWPSGAREVVPATLSTAYSADEARRATVPQHMYFYTLSCSPMENEEETRRRKARLRYHQPPPPSNPTSYYLPQPSRPFDIQSASTSPHDIHMSIAPPSLPHFHETVWTPQPVVTAQHPASAAAPPYNTIPHSDSRYLTHTHGTQAYSESPVPSAPFANAGPPGVHAYPTPVQRTSPTYQYRPNYARGRRY